jgi:hypothetical protein
MLTFDRTEVLEFLLATLLFWHALGFFIFLGEKWRRAEKIALLSFLAFWFGALALSASVKVKLFTTALVITTLVVRSMISKKRSLQRHSQ